MIRRFRGLRKSCELHRPRCFPLASRCREPFGPWGRSRRKDHERAIAPFRLTYYRSASMLFLRKWPLRCKPICLCTPRRAGSEEGSNRIGRPVRGAGTEMSHVPKGYSPIVSKRASAGVLKDRGVLPVRAVQLLHDVVCWRSATIVTRIDSHLFRPCNVACVTFHMFAS